MVNLKCGCDVTEDGIFILGECCENNDCIECKTLTELHFFGNRRFNK